MEWLYSQDEVYRPITEEDSILLEVQSGCSYHKCDFCDFRNDPYKLYSLEDIQTKIQFLAQTFPGKNRVFLLGQNTFHLSFRYLKYIFDKIEEYMPHIKEISMYARADDVERKTIAELQWLKQHHLTDLHIGLESGCNEVLSEMHKGVNVENYASAFKKLEQVGIDYIVTIIIGLGGQKYSQRHATETAAFLSQYHPKVIWALNLYVWENTPLKGKVKSGQFKKLSFNQMAEEEMLMLSGLKMKKNCRYINTTYLNFYTVSGQLPEGKNRLQSMLIKLYRQDDDIILK